MQNKYIPQNTLVKLSIVNKIPGNSFICPLPIVNSPEIYTFGKKGVLFMNYHENLMWRNEPYVAEIDLHPLTSYPEYEHHLHIQPYNEQNPFNPCEQIEIVVNFLKNEGSIGNPNELAVDLVFIDADIIHDTELFSKMDPYVKVKANGIEKWRSTTVKKGDKHPNFKEQRANITLMNPSDYVYIEIWDDDMKDDDLIGIAKIRGTELIGRKEEIIELELFYEKKSENELAGKIRIKAFTPGVE